MSSDCEFLVFVVVVVAVGVVCVYLLCDLLVCDYLLPVFLSVLLTSLGWSFPSSTFSRAGFVERY